jgi:hypothetical protein
MAPTTSKKTPVRNCWGISEDKWQYSTAAAVMKSEKHIKIILAVGVTPLKSLNKTT